METDPDALERLANAGQFRIEELYRELLSFNVYARKYFHPLCVDYVPYARAQVADVPNARLAAQQVLCLPFFGDMGADSVHRLQEILLFLRRAQPRHRAARPMHPAAAQPSAHAESLARVRHEQPHARPATPDA